MSQTVLYSSVTLVAASFFVQAACNFLLSMISNLSVILHMFLVKLNYSANLLDFMAMIFPLVTFDVIPTSKMFEDMFHLSDISDDYALED